MRKPLQGFKITTCAQCGTTFKQSAASFRTVCRYCRTGRPNN